MRLPRIMLAPNGARRTKADHPRLPMTVAELIEETRMAVAAGADGLHAHVRDAEGRHSLDAGLYRELLAETDRAFPGLFVQVTTESAGIYPAARQRALVRDLKPRHVSIALREMLADGETGQTADLFAFCADEGIDVQHILYDENDCRDFLRLRDQGVVPGGPAQVLHVLGRYSEAQVSDPAEVPRRAAMLAGQALDWGLCAFGRNETACLLETLRQGGKARIGFENNLQQPDGSIAESNAARVRDLAARL
ncbi:Uncharacterized conserved protein, DUF849 family [Paracoccus aminovorans]|uniref:Uncharacterized conserved protein, DUF849 family n=2 Tax=Paracoccus aminovorans TaxID=34004 RepID=A0A1I2ZSY0_9RHOB|nr:class III aminotransferase [Paracoccus aminovorans]SFH40864.1 Uncharacterized conserved protein, DUF849 family [Paracoccus aminovorans]